LYVWRTKITTQTPRISKNVISTSSSLHLPRPFCTSPQYCFTGVSLTFSTGEQLVFIGRQAKCFEYELLHKKILTRLVKLYSQLVSMPGS